jgi:anion-transporting  ArsA/GET3 family ATPase
MAPVKAGSRTYMKALSFGVSTVTNVMMRVLGAGFLRDVQTFVAALDTMFGGFRERADATYELLKAPGTSFLVVAAPERDALREASYFVERLSTEGMPLAGLVLNRVHRTAAPDLSAARSLAAAEELEEDGDRSIAAELLRLHADRMLVLARERRLRERFTFAHAAVPVVEVPVQPADVHDLDGLRAIGTALAA